MANESTIGLVPAGDYATPVGDANKVQALINLIADPDTRSSSGAQAGGNRFLDEMSPAAAAQLRVELNALKAAVT